MICSYSKFRFASGGQMLKNVGVLCCSVLFILANASAAYSQTEIAAKLISASKFILSTEDKNDGIRGKMKVAVTVKEDGTAKDAIVYVAPMYPCEGNFASRLEKIMKDAAKSVETYKFQPATKGGKPTETRVGVTIDLDEKPLKQATKEDSVKSISGGIVNGKATKLVKPPYPAEARKERAEGIVSVDVLIDESGKVASAQAVSGHPLLHYVSREAACLSKFSPTKLLGEPVKVTGVITYNFMP